jgi:fused signal recognition particle receptor
MFDQLRKAFSSATKSIAQKELSEKELENNLFDLQLALLEGDVAQEVIDDLVSELKKKLLGLQLERGNSAEEVIKSKLQEYLEVMFSKAGQVDLIHEINLKKEAKGGPYVIVFLGINGTGKTTTVAKIAHLLHENGLSVVLAAGDTHRAGAIEQLTQHAQKLSLKVIAQRYGADPSAVGRDAVDYSRKHHIDAVLIDTAGRMQTAKNLMDEIGKIVRVVKPDLKLFIGDSLAGNDTINQSTEFFQYTKFDGAILTKTDADAKGGAAVSIVHNTSKPIVYLGIGQGYSDIIPFDYNKFLRSIFSNVSIIDGQNLPSISAVPQPIRTESDTSEVKDLQKPVILPPRILEGNLSVAQQSQEEESKDTLHEISPSAIETTDLNSVTEKKDTSEIHPNKITSYESTSSITELEDKKKSKGLFGRLFSRKNRSTKGIEGELPQDLGEQKAAKDSEPLSVNDKQIKEASKMRDKKEENKDQEKSKKEEKIYLTDEDIEDLLK